MRLGSYQNQFIMRKNAKTIIIKKLMAINTFLNSTSNLKIDMRGTKRQMNVIHSFKIAKMIHQYATTNNVQIVWK